MIFFLLLFSVTAFADSFDSGISKTLELQQRASALLKKAGIAFGDDMPLVNPKEEKASFVKIHALPTTGFLPAGALAFGTIYFELLVGEEVSPVEIKFSAKNKYSWLADLKILGQATQSRGRVFIEFDRLITKSGKVIPVQGTMLDQSGALGILGKNQNSKIMEALGGKALGLFSAPEEKSDLFRRDLESSKLPLEARLKSSLLQESRNYLRDQMKENPVLKVEADTPVTILFKNEVRF